MMTRASRMVFTAVLVLFVLAVAAGVNMSRETLHAKMILTSPAFMDGSAIPKKFTCDGGDMNPELHIQNVPVGTKSLALIVDDPDAPSGNFVHWVVFNISPDIAVIKEESTPAGAREGVNSAGKIGYMGPCPPSGTHRYRFNLFALDARVPFSDGVSLGEIEKEMEHHVIEKTVLVGAYSR